MQVQRNRKHTQHKINSLETMDLWKNGRRRIVSKEHIYAFSRVKLSNLYNEIGKFLRKYGDADIRGVASCSGYDDKTTYLLRLADLNSFDTTKSVGEIRIRYEDVLYTEEEWKTGVITDSKIDTEFIEN